MTVLIVVGLFFVLYKITNFSSKSKFLSPSTTEFRLFQSETVQQVLSCGTKLCLFTAEKSGQNRLIVINPESGKVQNVVEFHHEAVKN